MTDDIERDGRGTSEPVMSNEYKVIIVGAVGVGKTSLLLRYVHNHFQDSANKFISEERKTVSVNGKELVLCLWDTAGQDRHRSLTEHYYSNADAAIVVYSAVDLESFQDLKDYWITEVHHYLRVGESYDIPVVIAANKDDLTDDEGECVVDFRSTVDFSRENGLLPPVRCSAKTGHNVKNLFHLIITEMYKRREPRRRPEIRSVTRQGCCAKRSSSQSQERYHSITGRFYHDASAVMIVYDISDAESYNEATTSWFSEVTTHLNMDLNIPIMLVGNKTDLEDDRVINVKDVKDFARKSHLLEPIECSAKTGKLVDRAFQTLAKEMVKRGLPTNKAGGVPHVTKVSKNCC